MPGATVRRRFHGFLKRKSIKKKLFLRARHLVVIYTPKEAHSWSFVTGGSVIAWQMLAKKNLFLAKPACNINITDICLLRQKAVGACLYISLEWILSSQFWSYIPPTHTKVIFFALQKWHFYIFILIIMDAHPLLKKNLRPIFFFFFFGCFCRKFCHADLDSREQQAILPII